MYTAELRPNHAVPDPNPRHGPRLARRLRPKSRTGVWTQTQPPTWTRVQTQVQTQTWTQIKNQTRTQEPDPDLRGSQRHLWDYKGRL